MKKVLLAGGLLLLGYIAQAQEPQANLDRNKRWTLQELVEYAYRHNLQVRQSELDLLSSQVELKRSKLDLLPDLNANANYAYSVGRSIDPITNLIIDRPITSQNYGINSGVTLFNGFALRNTIKQNNLNYEARQNDLADIRNDIGLNVATAYLNILLNQELLRNAEARLVSSSTQLERTQKLVDAGSQARANYFEVNAQVANDRLAVTNAQNNLELARLNLKQLLQIAAEETLLLEIPDFELDNVTPYPMAPSAVYEIAEANQPDIKAADLRVEGAELGIDVAKGNLWPVISAGAGASTAYSSIAPPVLLTGRRSVQVLDTVGFFSDAGNNTVYVTDTVNTETFTNFEENTYFNQLDFNLRRFVQVGINIPIFNGYRARSSVAQARISADRARIQQQQVRQQLRQNIEQAALDVQAAALSYRATKEQVNSLQEAFRATEQRFNLGASSALDYSVAKANLDAAEANFIRSKYDYIFRTKVLDFYRGQPLSFQ
jgi:outer membrane protein